MALKPITLRLDEEEYEKLKKYLSEFGDPDVNIAYVLRSYIRDLNRVFPLLMTSGWDLKNYFGFFGLWLKQVVAMSDVEDLTKKMFNWWALGYPGSPSREGGTDETTTSGKNSNTGRKEGGDDK
ncbi:MAG: hypothetical protein ABSA46_19260 [Thermodesulfovibrionales bacterium]|jgi:hypothetical protein